MAYLVNQYPKVSHTFIRREILALERQGVTVLRFSIRGWDAEVVDPLDHAEKAQTRYVLKDGLGPLAAAVVTNVLRRPGAVWTALKAALAMSRRSVRSWPYHLIWLAHACRLRLWLEGENVSHLHAHFGTNSADVAHLLCLLGGPSYSFTVHGADESDNARVLSFPRKTAAARFVVTVSSYTRAQLMRVLPAVDWPKLKVVHCGLDEGFFAETPAELPAEPVLLCIGRLCAEKGHLTLLEAFAKLDRPGVKLVFAGDGEFRALIEARIRDLRLEGRVQITGWIGSDEVRRLITQATIVVQPSLMEGLPVVLMEAMAQGRAVISTYIAGIPELVEAGRTGWLVPAGEIESLAAAMDSALSMPHARLDEMGRAGMARARARHHIDTEAAKLAALFAEGQKA
ncbi:MAG: glycosyltransferase family 4 protein [Fuscovulum sp.]|nr:MAG: glycosyltransferase family 4 protein [Fuscovulum sp.]